ncbi:glycosyltransferase [Thermodesulfobacteriota bacterium]
MLISAIIPSFNSQDKLVRLLDSLSNLSNPHNDSYEIIVVDDCSTDNTRMAVENYSVNYIRLNKNSGPAVCRNIGAGAAKGDVFAFTDSDCRVDRNWLENIAGHFKDNGIDAVMGKLIIDNSSFLGDSISALGFPAGGSIGFDKVWKVDKNGFTDSLSTCNCAIRRDAFKRVGGFNVTFPYAGGEDSFLAYSLKQTGSKIKYCADVIVHHEARDSLKDYISWQFKRGLSSYLFSSKVKNKYDYMSLRLWSISNVIKNNLTDKKLPLVLFLLITGYFTQMFGFLYGKVKEKN